MLREIDLKLRGFFSYIYRGIIVIYSLGIIICATNNIFPLWAYFSASILYFSLFYNLLKPRFRNKANIRLVIDYLFIYFIIYGKDIENITIYFLLILPIINSSNNSSDDINVINKCKRFHVYPFCFVGILLLSNFHFKLSLYFPLIVITIIDQFLKLRSSIESIHSVIFKLIDEFYTLNYGRRELALIYEELILKINTTPYTRNLKIRSIACFVLAPNNKLLLVNSSAKIFTFKFHHLEKTVKNITDHRFVFDFSVEINNMPSDRGLLALIKGTERKYVFLILVDNKIGLFHRFITPRIILLPILKHLAKIYQTQVHLHAYKTEFLDKLKNKSEYVLKSLEVMHFVKGSLSPIKGALTTSRMYDEEINPEKKEFLLQKYLNQRKIAFAEINNILERAKFLLEKSENPYIVSSSKNHSFYELLTLTRRRWYEYFYELDSDIILSERERDFESIMCQYDSDYLQIILTDLMVNMRNNSSGRNTLSFYVKEDVLEIFLSNSIVLTGNDYLELKKVVDSYNLNEKWEINKRKSHGLTNVKLYLKQMGIANQIILSEKEFIFKITFQIEQ